MDCCPHHVKRDKTVGLRVKPSLIIRGIVGYIGKRQASPILVEGLRRLEYRGYDSAGIALLHGGHLVVQKKKGKIQEGLARLVDSNPHASLIGIGHTRWATHGPPCDENSNPHLDNSGRIAVVHNGVIENYDRLKDRLVAEGHQFLSATDTKVLSHLIGVHYEKVMSDQEPGRLAMGSDTHPLAQAVMAALKEVIGTYGIAVVCRDDPTVMVAARRGSPLLLGLGEGENFVASDASAIVSHTRQVVYLKDYEVATLTADAVKVDTLGDETAMFQINQIEFDAEQG